MTQNPKQSKNSNTTLPSLGVDHLTFEGGGWFLQAYLYQKKFMRTTTAEKHFAHVQWAEKSMLRRENNIMHTHVPRKKISSAWKS